LPSLTLRSDERLHVQAACIYQPEVATRRVQPDPVTAALEWSAPSPDLHSVGSGRDDTLRPIAMRTPRSSSYAERPSRLLNSFMSTRCVARGRDQRTQSPLLTTAFFPHLDAISIGTRCSVLVRHRPPVASITPALPSQLPSLPPADTPSRSVRHETNAANWRQIKENRSWRHNDVVRAEGLEPSRHGLKVRTGPRVKDRPPMVAPSVASVFPVLSPLSATSVAGRPSAIVRPSRASRGGLPSEFSPRIRASVCSDGSAQGAS
jgi:hypothetical protein